MAEYVTKEQVIDWYRPYGQTDEPIPFETLVSDLRDMKAADVALVRHGRWFPTAKWWQGGSAWKQCSECGILHLGKSNFCSNCGARMDGE